MSYKIAIVTTVDTDYIRSFLSNNPHYNNLSYGDLHSLYIKTRCGWSDFYSRNLTKLGNEAIEILPNIEPLQKKWALENNVKYSEHFWLQDILLSQIKLYKPDILYLPDLYSFDLQFRSLIRENFKNIKIIGWRFALTKDYSLLSNLDLLLTGNHYFINKFKQAGFSASYLPLGFERSLLDEIGNSERSIDISFIGSTGTPNGIHSKRYSLIQHLMENTPMELWTSCARGKFSKNNRGYVNTFAHSVYNVFNFMMKNFCDKEKSDSIAGKIPLVKRGKYVSEESFSSLKELFPGRVHSPVHGIEAFKIISASKIVFNKHIDVAGGSGGNIRLFESTGLGACLLTDRISNLNDFFEPDYEVVTYQTKEEAIEKYNYLINHPAEREKIAIAGQNKTLTQHSLKQRVEIFNDYCLSLLKN